MGGSGFFSSLHRSLTLLTPIAAVGGIMGFIYGRSNMSCGLWDTADRSRRGNNLQLWRWTRGSNEDTWEIHGWIRCDVQVSPYHLHEFPATNGMHLQCLHGRWQRHPNRRIAHGIRSVVESATSTACPSQAIPTNLIKKKRMKTQELKSQRFYCTYWTWRSSISVLGKICKKSQMIKYCACLVMPVRSHVFRNDKSAENVGLFKPLNAAISTLATKYCSSQ